MSTKKKKVLSLFLALVMVFSLLPGAAFATQDDTSEQAVSNDFMKIVFLDCGRKYFSVDSIKTIIDNAAAAGFNYIQLAVGNDGLRFLLDDMSLTVNGTTYDSAKVAAAIHTGNETYYDFDVDELTQSEMDTIIAYANSKGLAVIPCVNTPGHMDAILDAAEALTGMTCAYNGSGRTIDVTNTTAVAFTQALLQKYIDYFAGKGCTYFNMGADEYANDKYTSGSMGFGNLQSTGKYSYYVQYVNQVARLIKGANMTPMAFNDGIYFNSNTSSGTFDTDIVICYWSNGWTSYTPMPAATLKSKGFTLVNTHGSYYWVLGKSDWQCDASKASGFDYREFQGGTIDDPAGAMFCIWCDYPGAGTEANVISSTAATIAAFGKTLPATQKPTVEDKTLKDEANDVTVTAPGLTSLTVSTATAPAISAAAEGKVVAYSVKPSTENGAYTGSATVSLPIPAGWDTSKIRGFAGGTTGLSGTAKDGYFTFTVPHFSTIGIYELDTTSGVEVTESKTINLTVGGTVTDTINGYNFSGTYHTDDPNIATVAVTGQDEQAGIPTYTQTSVTYGELCTTKDDWTKTEYFYKDDSGNYYPVYANYAKYTVESFLFLTTTTYYYGYQPDNSNDVREVNNSSNQTSTISSLYKLSGTTTTPASTTVIFNGVSAGTTYVTVGNTRYTIIVSAEDLSTVDPITVEYWITNREVTDANNATSKMIYATNSSVYSESGVLFSNLVPATGTYNSNTMVFWKGTRLTSDNKQTREGGVDKTTSGNDFTYVRYWEQKWSFSANGSTWTDFNSSDQIVAYYLQVTTVTDEVETQVVDWGEVPHTSYNSTNFVLLDYAVKYESGDRIPSNFPVTGKTQAFHCDPNDTNTVHQYNNGSSSTWSNNYRQLGMIRAENNSAYEVYMITVTPTSTNRTKSVANNAKNAKDYTYDYDNEKVIWVDDEANLGDFADSSKHFTSISGKYAYSVGGDPIVPGLEIFNRHGMLVTYYLRTKVTEDSLRVHYIDRTTNANNNEDFYSYPITVNSDVTFNQYIGLGNPHNGPLVNGTVTNTSGKTLTVTADLTEMTGVPAQYRYSDYDCYEVERSDDGKDVYLYYRFSSEKTFVVDYGLPITISPKDINANLGGNNVSITGVSVNKTSTGTITGDHGNVTINTDKSFTYTLNKMMSGREQLTVAYTGTIPNKETGELQNGTVTYTINIIPASTMYYEENFVDCYNGSGIGSAAWTDAAGTTPTNATQALEALGSKENLYGSDPAYNDMTTYSMNSAKQVTVTSDMATGWNATASWPTATFTFKGTGFDVISLTNNQSGAIFVDVYEGNAASGNTVKSFVVNNYYGYTQKDGQWVVDTENTSNNALYQIPVMKVSDLPYKQYTVKITLFYNSGFDKTNDNQYSFWLDAIRIYDPMDVNYADYAKDHEGYPQYINFHSIMTTDTQNVGKTVFIDGKGNAAVSEYTNYGPNNEVYLTNGQSVAFKLDPTTNIDTVQIGAKAPKGEKVTFRVGESETIIETATDMYYDITNAAKTGNVVTITNTGTGLLSLTNLKITYSTKSTTTLAALTDADQDAALKVVRSVFAAEAPVIEPFVPERFEAKWDRSVRAGQRATLTAKTSEDVAAISVDGQVIDSYRTYTERSGWGWNATRVTYRVFTYTVTPTETTDYTVAALNSDGVASTPITATLTVTTQRPGGWWGNGWWY